MMKNRFIVFAIVLICYGNGVFGQDQLSDWQSAAVWCDGAVFTNDDEELKGKVRYDDLQGNLYFRDGESEKTFNSRQVAMFRFFDTTMKRERLFYSLESEDRKFNIRRPMFFELIKEFKTFAVLSKLDPVQFNEVPGSPRGTQNSAKESNAVMRVEQFETICFMSPQGAIEPYLELGIIHKNGVFEERVRNKQTILDADLLKKYFGERAYQKIITYVEYNEFRLDSKEDFLKVLEYYEKNLMN